MVVSTYCCYEKVRRTMRTTIISNLLKENTDWKDKSDHNFRRISKELIKLWKVLDTQSSHPDKHFDVASTLFLVWYDVATSDNVKSTLKQYCVRQHWNLQCWTTSNQRCRMWTLIWTTLDNVETIRWVLWIFFSFLFVTLIIQIVIIYYCI